MMPYSPLVKNNEASNTLNYVNMNFLDKVSGQSPSKISVTVYSNNGRICDTIPCDNNYKFWQAVTDASGNIYVPVDYVQLATTVILDGYKESVLRYDKAKNVYTISVEPNAPNTDDFVINP